MAKAKRKKSLKSKKALSPVIATVILVAVTITVAIAVAYWMGGIAGLYTRLEKVEITTVQQSYVAGTGWTLVVGLKNSGSADATIDTLLINGNIENDLVTNPALGLPVSVGAGKSTSMTFVIPDDGSVPGCTSGTTIDLKLHSAAGKEYPQMVTLA